MRRILLALCLFLLSVGTALAVCPPNLPMTASGPDMINAINQCAGGVGGGTPYPGGSPPQLAGFSGTNVPEGETITGDCAFTRAGANSYTISCSKSGGQSFGAAAFLGVGSGLSNSGGNINLGSSGVTPGSYASANITVNAQGQVTTASNGSGGGGSGYPAGTAPQLAGFSDTSTAESETLGGDCSLTRPSTGNYSIVCTNSNGQAFGGGAFLGVGTGLNNSGGTLNIANTGVVANTYNSANITVNAQGQITSASNGTGGPGGVTSVSGSPPISSSGGAAPTISLNNSGVVAGSYTNSNITVDATGRVTTASNGTGGGGGTAAINTHPLIESGNAATVAAPTSSTNAGIDVNYITLNGNLLLTMPTTGQMADGEHIIVKATESGPGTYTVQFSGPSGVILRDDTPNGSNTTVGSACLIPTGGWELYEFEWHSGAGVLELKQCEGNPSVQLVHGLSVSFSGAPPASAVLPTVCPYNLTFPGNFGTCVAGQGTCVSCGTPPSESDRYSVKVAGNEIGALTLTNPSGSCVAQFTTNSGAQQSCLVGQRLEIDTPATVSGANIGITFGAKQS